MQDSFFQIIDFAQKAGKKLSRYVNDRNLQEFPKKFVDVIKTISPPKELFEAIENSYDKNLSEKKLILDANTVIQNETQERQGFKSKQGSFNKDSLNKLSEEELKTWKEYLKVNNAFRLVGGYGRQEDLTIGSKTYTFTDIKAAFEKLSNEQKGKDLQARFRAYADMYQAGAVYKYHDNSKKAIEKGRKNIEAVSDSIHNNAGYKKFIPKLLKEIEN
jgi:hypothetical protein